MYFKTTSVLCCTFFLLNTSMIQVAQAEEFSISIKNTDSCKSCQPDEPNCSSDADDLKARIAELEGVIKQNRVSLCGSGMQDSRITDEQISSNGYSSNHPAHHHKYARLFGTAGASAWCADTSKPEMWIQVDLYKESKVYGVATQGRVGYDQWVTKYEVLYKMSAEDEFQRARNSSDEGNVLDGNDDRTTVVQQTFARPVTGRYFRIKVVAFTGHPSLRFDLLLC